MITTSELIQILLDTKGAKPVTFTAITDARAKVKAKFGTEIKKNPFNLPITKTSKVNGMVNFYYDKGVYRRLKNEGKSPNEFRKGESWHEPVTINNRITPICVSKNPENPNTYLRFLYLKSLITPTYHDSLGNLLCNDEVYPFIKKSTYENQGLQNPLIIKVYNINNIQEITINKITYTIQHEQTPIALAS